MNLEKLFEIQRKLDNKILNRFPELKNEDLLPKKILSLQVELAELAQNWRGFKFWSKDQEPNTDELSIAGHKARRYNPLLEEYVDCLHFILSIGLELKLSNLKIKAAKQISGNITHQFLQIQSNLSALWLSYRDENSEYAEEDYRNVFALFLGIGEMLGFTWEQIEQSYLEKNKINHERQDSNY